MVVAGRERGGGEVPCLVHTYRRHTGTARLNQVRNNGLRALERVGVVRPEDLVVVMDGDMVLAPRTLERYAALAADGYDMIISHRVNLDEGRSGTITPEAILIGDPALASLVRPEEMDELARRQRRYERQMRMRERVPRWVGLIKAHKPKVLGGLHGVSVRRLWMVNGYDEEYVGYGYDDDDLSRRLYATDPPPRTAIAMHDVLALHLWHPRRGGVQPREMPGYARFARADLPVVARLGWRTPMEQPPPVVRVVETGRGGDGRDGDYAVQIFRRRLNHPIRRATQSQDEATCGSEGPCSPGSPGSSMASSSA